MIFAAGLGTRLKTETAQKPKALVDINGKPLLLLAIEKLKNEGVSKIVVNVHHFSGLVINWINSFDFGIPVYISDETEKLLDTGGGLKKAAKMLAGTEPVLIYNVDIISQMEIGPMVSQHLKTGAMATLAVAKRETQRYFTFDSNLRLTGWKNKATDEKKISIPGAFEQSDEYAYCGFHVIHPSIFDFMPADDRFSIVDFYLELTKAKPVYGFTYTSDLWIDVGKPEELEKARLLLK